MEKKMPDSEFYLTEYKEAVEMYRTEFTVWTQVLSALLLAYITVLGLAVSTQKAGLFMISALILLGTILGSGAARSYLVGIAYRAIILEEKYGDGSRSFISTLISFFYSPQYVDTLKQLEKIDDFEKRIQQLKESRRLMSKRSFLLSLSIITAHLLLVPLMMFVFQWSFA